MESESQKEKQLDARMKERVLTIENKGKQQAQLMFTLCWYHRVPQSTCRSAFRSVALSLWKSNRATAPPSVFKQQRRTERREREGRT